MYLKNIGIKNIGPINELSIELPFDSNNKPKPILLVGQNGTGKTILLSQIVDSLYEVASETFTDVGKYENQAREYYKVSGSRNLKIGETTGYSIIKFEDTNNDTLEYFDKIGSVTLTDFQNFDSTFSLTPNNKPDNEKKFTEINDVKKSVIEKEWQNSVHIYQPAYRYEEPFWKNENFYDNEKFTEQNIYQRRLGKELEIISSIKENKSYIMDLVLDFSVNANDILGKSTWANINNIIRKIKQKENIRFGIGPRGRGNRISLVELDEQNNIKGTLLNSIDNLSLGESILLNLFVNIIRHGDTPPKITQDIKGIVIIDEIDVHLHTDLQNKVLPKLIKLFPNVQFIITTHSPLFILGMEKELGTGGIEIRNMPNGETITSERFSEFENAYKVLKDTEKFENEITSSITESHKPIVFVEGDYDIRYIKKASEFFNKNEILDKIDFIDVDGYNNLNQIWKHKTNLFNAIPQNMLLLYDCDTEVSNDEKDKISKRIIPYMNENYFDRGIENLFSEETIIKARNFKKAFIDYTPEIKKEIRGEEIIEKENYSINPNEKGNLCNWLCENGTQQDFTNFNIIFDIFEEFLEK